MNDSSALRPTIVALVGIVLGAAVGGAGCGDEPGSGSGDCDLLECAAATPAPICSDDGTATLSPTRVTGCADDGSCEYEYTQEACTNGCRDGACLARCADEQCLEPAEPRCNGNTLVTRVLPGQVDDFATCACTYRTQRQDCGDDVCFDGECRPFECAFLACDEPPPAACEGDVSVRYPVVGTCVEETRDCEYTPTRTDCAAAGGSCVQGACVDACADVDCTTPPSPRCEGDVAAVPDSTGTCSQGRCTYEFQRQNCTDIGALCLAGACQPICEDAACTSPPSNICEGTVAVQYALLGACNETHECVYGSTRTDCATAGQVCRAGACVEDPGCTGIVCNTPPAEYCEGDVAHQPEAIGECLPGPVCEYDELEIDCAAADGRVCLRGRCELFCDTTVCVEPPDDYCDGDIAILHSGVGTCSNPTRSCSYTQFPTNCAILGQRCVDGDCVGDCVPADCDEPPPSFCVGNQVYDYEPIGFCTETDLCDYDFEPGEDCAATGRGCLLGACVDLCSGGVCNDPPAPSCEGRVAVNPSGPGTCVADVCQYEPNAVDCAATGRFCGVGESGAFCRPCVGAECAGPCDGVTCTSPSGETGCEDDVAWSSFADGVCVDGACEYPVDQLDCQEIGAGCLDGLCSYGCEGLACEPAAPTCLGFVLVEDGVAGPVCYDGACHYERLETDCLRFGRTCSAGACRSTPDICALVSCNEPGPLCDGDVVVTRSGPGTCDAGPPTRCVYGGLETRTPCGAGLGCVDGACVRVPQPGEIIFTEIAYDPAGADPGLEWFELYNTSSVTLSLAGHHVVTTNGRWDVGHLSIAPSGYLVLASGPGVAVTYDDEYPYFALPLENVADTLSLVRGASLVDRVAYDERAGWPNAAGTVLSLTRTAYGHLSNDAPSAWCATATTTAGAPFTCP